MLLILVCAGLRCQPPAQSVTFEGSLCKPRPTAASPDFKLHTEFWNGLGEEGSSHCGGLWGVDRQTAAGPSNA